MFHSDNEKCRQLGRQTGHLYKLLRGTAGVRSRLRLFCNFHFFSTGEEPRAFTMNQILNHLLIFYLETGACYLTQSGSELAILQPQSPRLLRLQACVPPRPAAYVFFWKWVVWAECLSYYSLYLVECLMFSSIILFSALSRMLDIFLNGNFLNESCKARSWTGHFLHTLPNTKK